MKTISCWNDLTPFGIVTLTGESCGLGYRILFDVTAFGKRILEKYFGCELKLAENWNRGAEEDPHVGSILLSREMLVPVGIFALLENGCSEVWLYSNGSLVGIEPSDPPDRIEMYRTMYQDTLMRTFAYRGTAGDRNVHMMSGRIT